jgi:hypothetical protein
MELFDCTDEKHAISLHDLQNALMLTVEFLKMYYTESPVPTLPLEQYQKQHVIYLSSQTFFLEHPLYNYLTMNSLSRLAGVRRWDDGRM